MSGLTKSVPGLVRSGRCLVVAALVFGASGTARAQGGFLDFFNQAFGGGGSSQPSPQRENAQPAYQPADGRPLTVRGHERRHRLTAGRGGGSGGARGGSIRYNVADLKGVTMYTDKTLTRGDAVMTPTGIKVFNGSTSWPYTDDDFVAIAASGKMPTVLRKELTALDNASRPGFQR